ncbi:HNH endonuclease [Arthrospira platensis SPKY2]
MSSYNHLIIYSNENNKLISPRVLFSSFKRSNEGYMIKSRLNRIQCNICCLCIKPFKWSELELDHIIPLVLIPSGYENLITSSNNLQLICSNCNKKKGTKYEGEYLIRNRINNEFIKEDYSKDIYKDYKSLISNLINNKYENKKIQSIWNRNLIKMNEDLKKVKQERLIFDIIPKSLIKIKNKNLNN